jgi:hypothetical protein
MGGHAHSPSKPSKEGAKFSVPEAEHNELFAIVESTKGDIVTAPSSS